MNTLILSQLINELGAMLMFTTLILTLVATLTMLAGMFAVAFKRNCRTNMVAKIVSYCTTLALSLGAVAVCMFTVGWSLA